MMHVPVCGDGMLKWSDLPQRFIRDSIDREVFQPEGQMYCSLKQARKLLDDAEFYIEPLGPDLCPPGLKQSARALVGKIRQWLENENNKIPLKTYTYG